MYSYTVAGQAAFAKLEYVGYVLCSNQVQLLSERHERVQPYRTLLMMSDAVLQLFARSLYNLRFATCRAELPGNSRMTKDLHLYKCVDKT